jgi:hypothetical protein
MAPIFAAADIQSIIAAFPPPQPSSKQATLLRSVSGERLLNSRKVLNRLDKILASSPERLPVHQLSSLLGIKDAIPLLETAPFVYSRNRSSLIPIAEQKRILNAVHNATERDFIEIGDFSRTHDIELQSLRQCMSTSEYSTAVHHAEDGKYYAYQPARKDEVRRDIQALISNTRPQKCNISNEYRRIPSAVMTWIVDFPLDNVSFEVGQNGLVAIPAEYHEYRTQSEKAARDSRHQKCLADLSVHGFAVLYDYGDISERLIDYEKNGPSGDLVRFSATDGTRVIAMKRSHRLAEELVTRLTKMIVSDRWQSNSEDRPHRITTSDLLSGIGGRSDTELGLVNNATNLRRLATLVVSSDSFEKVFLPAANTHGKSLQASEKADWNTILLEEIRYPFQLYRNSLEFFTNADSALKETHTQQILLAFQQNHLQPALEHLKGKRLLLKSSRSTAMRSLISLNAKPLELASFEPAFQTLLQDQRLNTSISNKQLCQSKLIVLCKKVDQIASSSNAAWTLQNVIWILLSHVAQQQGAEALFASAGKDTTKMLRLYERLVASTGSSEQTKAAGVESVKLIERFKKGTVAKSLEESDWAEIRNLASDMLAVMET